MTRAIADPDDIRLFAQQLKKFNDELGERSRLLRAQFIKLGETWRDQEHRKFAKEFTETMTVIDRFQRTAERQIPPLQRKARELDRYLGRG